MKNDLFEIEVPSYRATKDVECDADIIEEIGRIIGYDNIDLAEYFSPPLTTIHQPKRRVGKTAFEILLSRIKDKEHERRIFEMHPELIIRESVKNLRQ